MKNSRAGERNLYLLLVKNYIIFTLVMALLVLAIYGVQILVERSILQTPDMDKPLGGQELLAAEDYDGLTMKKLLGTSGYFEVVDEQGSVIYTNISDGGMDGEYGYTREELQSIQAYDSPYVYSLTEFDTQEGEQRILLQKSKVERDTGYRQDLSYMILDGSLSVIQGSDVDSDRQFTRRELDFLTGKENAWYSICKYEFTQNQGEKRTLIMHIKRPDRKQFERLRSLWKFFLPAYLFCYMAVMFGFTMWIHRKVKRPLAMLKDGMNAFAEGELSSELSYEGPKEFESIFYSFNKMAAQLKESEEAKEQLIVEKQRMLADISHDLKTPITVIQGYAKAVSDGLVSQEAQKQHLDTIYQKAESLTELINTFYDYSKLEHPEFRLVRKEQDLAEFMREYLASKYDEIELLGFELEVEIPEREIDYSFDEVQLRRVFENIFSNSLKHNPDGTTLYVTMQQTDRSIRIEMGDNGSGIPVELQDKLFEPFTVGDDSRHNRQGSGLGLAVARKIVELHGGALFLEKSGNPAISTLFVIRLMK